MRGYRWRRFVFRLKVAAVILVLLLLTGKVGQHSDTSLPAPAGTYQEVIAP